MKLYTKTGDEGETRLGNGKMVLKSDKRVIAYGGIDELISVMGIVVVLCHKEKFIKEKKIFIKIQQILFQAAAYVAKSKNYLNGLLQEQTCQLEQHIDEYDGQLPLLKKFILPSGTMLAVQLHLARTVCRRVERDVAYLFHVEKSKDLAAVLKYLNRLSDLFFVLSRYVNKKSKRVEVTFP